LGIRPRRPKAKSLCAAGSFSFTEGIQIVTKTGKRADVYTRVTNQIVEQLERGVRPRLQPWNATHAAGRISRPLRSNGEAYKGINVLMLYMAAEMHGYNCPIWMTYKQAQSLGGFVRKGEHDSPVVYASTFTKTETTDEGAEIEHEQAFLKEYTVAAACRMPKCFISIRWRITSWKTAAGSGSGR
jgi:antirestriction protein ArdC